MNKVASLNYDGSSVPTAFVTKGRQRVKQYNKGRQRVKQYNNTTVYLNNGDEFEIELFNPTPNKVMAKIDLNGVSIGPGIVLNPGQRHFLERYVNEAKKFLYMTYEVDGGNADVQRAIANNGDVSIKFYVETPPPSPILTYTHPWWYTTIATPYYVPTYGTTTYTTNNANITPTSWGSGFASGKSSGSSSHNMGQPLKSGKLSKSVEPQSFASGQAETQSCNYMSASMDFMDAPEEFERSFAEVEKTIETGRIEKGSNSSQSFGKDYSTFNTYWSWKTDWKILPLSQKPVEVQDLVLYCTGCQRRRRKQSDIFCPKCGKRY